MNAIVQYWIIWEKFNTRIYHLDLYNAIDKFYHEATLDKEDIELLLKRLYNKKIKDS